MANDTQSIALGSYFKVPSRQFSVLGLIFRSWIRVVMPLVLVGALVPASFAQDSADRQAQREKFLETMLRANLEYPQVSTMIVLRSFVALALDPFPVQDISFTAEEVGFVLERANRAHAAYGLPSVESLLLNRSDRMAPDFRIELLMNSFVISTVRVMERAHQKFTPDQVTEIAQSLDRYFMSPEYKLAANKRRESLRASAQCARVASPVEKHRVAHGESLNLLREYFKDDSARATLYDFIKIVEN